MALPLLMAAGAAISFYGKMQADADQADAERQNASYYREQASFTMEATKRESRIFQKKSVGLFGQQVGAFAKGGVSLSGDAMLVLAGEKAAMQEEDNAIMREGEFRARLANLRAVQSDKTADSLSGSGAFLNNLTGTALSIYGASK